MKIPHFGELIIESLLGIIKICKTYNGKQGTHLEYINKAKGPVPEHPEPSRYFIR